MLKVLTTMKTFNLLFKIITRFTSIRLVKFCTSCNIVFNSICHLQITCFRCLKCCFWCLEKFMKFLNKNAYIMVSYLFHCIIYCHPIQYFVINNINNEMANLNDIYGPYNTTGLQLIMSIASRILGQVVYFILQTAVYGKNFCTSAKNAFFLIMRNIVRYVHSRLQNVILIQIIVSS